MPNIELNYFNGSSYITLYPKISLNNNDGTVLFTSYVPNLDASKITTGTFNTNRIPTLPASQISTGTFGGSKGTEYVFPGNIRVGGTSSNSDAYIRIGDSDFVHFHEDSDDNLTIKAKRIEFTTTSNPGLTNNGVALGGGSSGHQGVYTGTGNYICTVNYPTRVSPNVYITISSDGYYFGANVKDCGYGFIFNGSRTVTSVTKDIETTIDFDDTYKYIDI